MRAIFKSNWVRKLIGKLGVPYNRRLGVRGSSHPLFYEAGLSLAAAESNAFRNQIGWPSPDRRIAALICFASTDLTLIDYTSSVGQSRRLQSRNSMN